MKKINLLLTIPALVAPATLVLSQCSKTSAEGIFLDTQVSDKAAMQVQQDSQGNQICEVKLNEDLVKTHKFSSVKVTFNGTDLGESEYDIDLEEALQGVVSVRILKSTLDSKKGSYVVCPTIEEKQFTGIIAELERITYHIGDTVTKNNITVSKSLEGTQGDVISWTENIKVYDYDETTETATELPYFKTQGLTLATLDQKTLKIVYGDFYTFVQINVSKKEYTITCEIADDECGTLSSKSFVAFEGDTWGPLAKPNFQPKEDVDVMCLTWDWYDEDGEVIPGTYTINSEFTAYMISDFASDTTSESSFESKTLYDKWGVNAYLPEQCVSGTGEAQTTIPLDLDTNTKYTFSITIPTDKSIKYFWLANYDTYKSSDLLHLYDKSILSIQHGGQELGYAISDDHTYIEFENPITEGTITVEFRMLKSFSGIPVFQETEE